MVLSQFILTNLEAILAEWEKFARTIPATAGMDRAALRNDAGNILKTIAREMEIEQSAGEQERKSQGTAVRTESLGARTAELHSSVRLDAGFNLNEVVSEYRALRASVIRLWSDDESRLDGHAVYDLTRFNEGIDQALSESIAQYTILRDRSNRESDRRKDEFLATLAHELRNPLAPLRNALHIVRHAGTNAEGSVVGFSDIFAMMERQVDHMVRLVDDLLDVARISRGTLELRIQTTDLLTVVNHALETCAPILKQGGHEVSVSLPTSPVYVEGDATRLAQVVCNLLHNAAKYSPAHSPIHLTVEWTGADIELTVEDMGMGIAPDMLEAIFEMFLQVDRSLERSKSGLGIGLTLARQLVEMHGGTIRATSEGIGRGSKFIVGLPQSSRPPVVKDSPAATKETIRPDKILIADDNRDYADSMGMLLREKGHDVHVVYDGLEALTLATQIQPDVLLLDLGMPKMNGFNVAKNIRQQAWSSRSILIAVSGWGQNDDRQTSKDAGFDYHLIKPVELNAIEQVLSEFRGERQAEK